MVRIASTIDTNIGLRFPSTAANTLNTSINTNVQKVRDLRSFILNIKYIPKSGSFNAWIDEVS